jgi:hypothetical protein
MEAAAFHGKEHSPTIVRGGGVSRISAKPSPIRTVTVGFGFAPNLSLPRTIYTAETSGLDAYTHIRAIPPVGNYTLPRRSLL